MSLYLLLPSDRGRSFGRMRWSFPFWGRRFPVLNEYQNAWRSLARILLTHFFFPLLKKKKKVPWHVSINPSLSYLLPLLVLESSWKVYDVVHFLHISFTWLVSFVGLHTYTCAFEILLLLFLIGLLSWVCCRIQLMISNRFSFVQVNFVVGQLFALMMAVWFRIYLHPSKASPFIRHVVATLLGFYLALFCFGWWVLLTLSRSLCLCFILPLPSPLPSRFTKNV